MKKRRHSAYLSHHNPSFSFCPISRYFGRWGNPSTPPNFSRATPSFSIFYIGPTNSRSVLEVFEPAEYFVLFCVRLNYLTKHDLHCPRIDITRCFLQFWLYCSIVFSKAWEAAQRITKLSPEISRKDTMLATISLQFSLKNNWKAHIALQETLKQLKKKWGNNIRSHKLLLMKRFWGKD